MRIRTILMSSSCIILSGAAWGQTAEQCAIAPTCAELGYEQKAADCNGQYMLKCPFDKTAVFCGGINCSYTRTSLSSGCSTADSCINNKGKIYYSDTCTTCYTGYTLNSSGNCSQTCTYTNTSSAPCGNKYSSCRRGSASGTTTYYKCTGPTCGDGYYWNSSFGGNGDCESCSYKYRNGRTSGPYSQAECDSFDVCICGTSPITYSCGNQTWYGCKEACNCAV